MSHFGSATPYRRVGSTGSEDYSYIPGGGDEYFSPQLPPAPFTPRTPNLGFDASPRVDDYYELQQLRSQPYSDDRYGDNQSLYRRREERDYLAYDFSRKRQFWSIMWPLLCRFAVDVVLWIVFIVIIDLTSDFQGLTREDKHLFNVAAVGMPLMLGLNYNSSFKSMAGVMRWKILASGKYTLREVRWWCFRCYHKHAYLFSRMTF